MKNTNKAININEVPYSIVIDLLRKGERNAIKAERIQEHLRYYNIIKNIRSIRQIILDLRKEGIIIAASSAGYFIPDNLEELSKYINIAKKRSIAGLIPLKYAIMQEKEMIKQDKPLAAEQLSLFASDISNIEDKIMEDFEDIEDPFDNNSADY